MNKHELEELLYSPAQLRYNYFVDQVTLYDEVWIIIDEGGGILMTTDEDGNKILPVWPFEEFARYCLSENMNNCHTVPVNIHDFMKNLLGGMKEDGILVSVFWNLQDSIIIEIDQLLNDLNEELSHF